MSLLEDEKKAEEREKAVANERTKLTATYMNGAAITVLAVGGFTVPLNGVVQGTSSTGNNLIALSCVVASLVLHFIARHLLGDIR